MSDFGAGARVRVGGATGMAGGGATTGEVDAAIAAAVSGLSIPTVITDLTDVDLTGAAAGDHLVYDGSGVVAETPASITVTTAATYLIDGGGATITTGVKGDLMIPFAGTITKWTILPDQSGSISIGVWKDSYANYPPVSGDLIFSATLGADTKSQSGALSYAIAAGDILRFNVASVTSVQRVTLALTMDREVGP
jgi:hypothetical protein